VRVKNGGLRNFKNKHISTGVLHKKRGELRLSVWPLVNNETWRWDAHKEIHKEIKIEGKAEKGQRGFFGEPRLARGEMDKVLG